MFNIIFIINIVEACMQLIKEYFEPKIPANYWGNTELYYRDVRNGVSNKQLIKNLKNGKYKSKEEEFIFYSEPKINPITGNIVIENYELYRKDVDNYGIYKALQFAKHGKYNLN